VTDRAATAIEATSGLQTGVTRTATDPSSIVTDASAPQVTRTAGRKDLGRDSRLDFLRGVAVLLVICMHAASLTPGMPTTGWVAAIFVRGAIGVQLFFILSGIVIYGSWRRLATRENAARIFYIKRASKLVPLYIVFLAVHLLVWLYFAVVVGDPRPFINFITPENLTAGNVTLHLLFLQEFTPTRLHTLLDGSWSILCEAYFYLLFPLIYCLCSTVRSTLYAYAGSLVLCVIAIAVLHPLAPLAPSISYYNFLAQLPVFLLGVLVAKTLREPAAMDVAKRLGAPLLLTALVFMGGMIKGDVLPLAPYHLYAIAMSVAIVVALPQMPRFEGSRLFGVVAQLGVRSYAIFWVHLVVFKIVGYCESHGSFTLSPYVAFPLNLAGGTLLSAALGFWIFHPADRFFVNVANRLLLQREGAGVSNP
jgi:peptidoglycan/LPS O-acetylase OafA/YrhL